MIPTRAIAVALLVTGVTACQTGAPPDGTAAHGYAGIETDVVDRVTAWIRTQ